VEFVFLDYNLHQGNGLQCLKALRMRDPIVPIIAISGMATAEVSGDLVAAGADDYINKRDLTTAVLAHSLRDSLRLADAWRKRAT
jgi:DNA-binding response OmpR family regulator